MTVRELYERVDGCYEQAVCIMKTDKLIDRYVRRFGESDVMERLHAAGESMDGFSVFEAAHAMKGVCANLGFERLADAAGELAEEFRPGSERQFSDQVVREKLQKLGALYRRTLDGIRDYEQQS